MKLKNNQKLNKIISRTLNLTESEIHESLTPEKVEGWDSFSGIQMVSEIERLFGILFEMEELFEIESIGDVRRLVGEKVK